MGISLCRAADFLLLVVPSFPLGVLAFWGSVVVSIQPTKC